MNTIKRFLLLLFIVTIMLPGCQKDPGNYVYTTINEAIVTGIDSLYAINEGDTLHIEPKITYTKDQLGDTSNYSYSWLLFNKEGVVIGKPRVFWTKPVLNTRLPANNGLGEYNCSFRITDKKTNVWKEYYFKVLIANDVYEGWLLLSETSNQQSRLDMLSYKANTNRYKFIPDVLGRNPSLFQLKGKPSFIAMDQYNPIVATSEIATSLNKDNLLSELDFSFFVRNRQNIAKGVGTKLESSILESYLWADGKLFSRYLSGDYVDINKMAGSHTSSFRTSPFFSMESYSRRGGIVFNETASEFVWFPGRGYESCYPIENENLFKNKIDKDLLFMKFVNYNGGETFAILKNRTDNEVYLARFTREQQNYFDAVNSSLIAGAEHLEVSSDFGYIFYSIGGKLYSYDFNLKLNKEMLDYGRRKISLLKFQSVNIAKYTQRYQRLSNKLVVCTYDEADLDHSGTIDLYSIPPIQGPLVKEESYSGMGKVVSTTYRAR